MWVLVGVPATTQALPACGKPRCCPPLSLAALPLQVWDLSDIDKDGHLDRDEFAVVGPCRDSFPASWGWGLATRVGISGLFSFFFYWSIVALQYYVSFCHTVKWSSCMCTYIPSLPSWIFFFLLCFFIYLSMPYGTWDLCSPTRDGTCALCIGKAASLIAGPPRDSSCLIF